MKLCNHNNLFQKFKSPISLFVIVLMIANMMIFTPSIVLATANDSNNGEWNLKNVIKEDTSEAQLMVRVGDIDNFGYGWNNNFDPFSGNDTPTHAFPFTPQADDSDGTDRVMVVSGYDYSNSGVGVQTDGYTGSTSRPSNNVRAINLQYNDRLDGLTVKNAIIQMFVDDFQPMKPNGVHPGGISKGNNHYKVWINDVEIPELAKIINSLEQGGPIGKMITFQIPDSYIDLVKTGSLSIKIDDKRSEITGDGHGIDFVKLLINKKGFSNVGTIKGHVKYGNKKVEGATVSAGGVVTTITDNKGFYKLTGVPAGQALVTVTKPGFQSKTQAVNVVEYKKKTQNFNLEKIPQLPTPTFNYTPDTQTTENVQVTITYPDNPEIKEYRIGQDGLWITYNEPFEVEENCVIEARGKKIYDDYENVSEIGSLTIDNINKKAPEVNIKVSDASGLRNTYEVTSENLNKRVDVILDSNITLQGDAFANINVIGKEVDFFKYQFIENSETPSQIPGDGWESIELNEELVNEDVVLEKNGFLNQRSYDVSHLGTISDRDKWNNQEEVYKNSFDATTYKAAKYSSNPNDYGQWEEYLKSDGTISERWVTNSVFMDNMNIGGSTGNEDYKEASKFWGYIKVPTTGNYVFSAVSDDGCRGYITVNGETKAFVDMFQVQSPTYGSTNNVYELEADKYYPIYLEYFNWGGGAAFEIKYSDNNGTDWERVPQNYFYPSKNITPGEYATSIFTGSKGVIFPTESGDYYIAFKTGKGTESTREGIYGPFTVNGKSTINVSKAVNGGNTVTENNEFMLEYTITPEDIEARSTFKENGQFKQKIYLSNVKLQDEYADNIEIKTDSSGTNIVKNGQKITANIPNIEYNLVTKNGAKVYSAEPKIIQVQLSASGIGDYILSEPGKSIITFTDVNKANRQIEFEPMILTVKSELRSSLTVLEIQPNRTFELNKDMFSEIVNNVESVNLVQMSINEFIGTIDKVNGKYDIVYVGSKTGDYTNIGSKPFKLPQNTKRNGSDSLEYYSENDITNNKAKDLKEFIESGQLTIFADKAFNNEQTKLYSNFHEFSINNNNFITTDNIVETVKTISNLYDECNKRPILTIANSPKEFTGTLDNGTSSSYIETKVMNFTFDLENLNTIGNNENSMNVKLYLDENGDGFFRDDEMVKQGEPRFNGSGYLLDYRLKNYFTGMMPWKLEIEDTKTKAKAYKTGYPAYKGQKLNVRVLQLIPQGNNFNIKDMKVPLNTEYYNVEVTTLTTDKFNKNYPNDIDNIKTELNGNYDMIILGFSDGFNKGDLTIKSIDAIKEFIKTGQGVMFTHDTMSYHVNNYGNQSQNLTQQFRDLIGQSRYNNSLVEDKNKPDIARTEFYSDDIVHDELIDSNKISYGFTKAILDVKNNITSSHPQVNKTYKLNEGLFTKYPYILADNTGKQLNIATTHEQFFQLNLEDEDVIPWFTLDGRATNNSYVYDKYDGRNNYYTYTKGNITYSGTGHSKPDGNGNRIDEHKMFMNTIIKASRSANHAPILEVINLEENKIVSKSQEQFEFSFIASDIDGDALSGSIYINDKLVPNFTEKDIKQGEQVSVVITKEDLAKLVGNEEAFTIKIVVEDSEGAVAEKNANLRYFDKPVLNMTIDKKQEYLVGDTATVKLQVVANNSSENLKTEINNINFSMDYSEEAMTLNGDSNWDNMSNVIFNPEPNPKVQEKRFEFSLNKDGNYSVENTLMYDYTNFDRNDTQNFSYPISVRSGIIDVTVLNSEGKAFESVDVTVTSPNGNVENHKTDANSKITLIDQPSGRYTFSINGLDTKYIINGGASKTIDLSYDNDQQEVRFEIVDTSKIGIKLTSNGGNQYLVGDTANINLTATAHNNDENINTTIHNIIHSMQYDSNELELITEDNSWNLNDIEIIGSNIPNNKEQSKNFRFDIKKIGDYQVTNTLEYEYLDGANGIESETHNFHVRSGRIRGKVTKPDDTSYAGAIIEIVNEEDADNKYQETTNSHGNYNFDNIPSGNYSILVKLPEEDGFVDGESNSRKVALSFDDPEHEIDIELEDSTVIINSGMYINNNFVSNNRVVTGFDAYLATEFKVFGDNPNVRLFLDKMIDKVEWNLYKVDSFGKLSVASGKMVYKNNEEKRELKIEVLGSTNESNHYLLKYTVSQKAPVTTEESEHLEYYVKVNDVEGNVGKLKVVPMPILD